MTDQTKPNKDTAEADRRDAFAEHGASEEPTPEEERLAEQNTVTEDVAETYREATERGANQQGEGRITS